MISERLAAPIISKESKAAAREMEVRLQEKLPESHIPDMLETGSLKGKNGTSFPRSL